MDDFVFVRRNISMRLALFVTCLVDLMRPSIGFAALRLLESAGCEVVVPPAQTCCGQPAYSAGERRVAAALARQVIETLEGYEAVVVPSGSCAAHLCQGLPDLLADDPAWLLRAQALAGQTHELTRFLTEVRPVAAVPGRFAGTATYHDSCKGLRGLGIQGQPRALLAKVAGLTVKEMADCQACCGFGGAFSVDFPALSTAIADDKCNHIAQTGADAVVGGDLGCLLHLEGRLRRRGDQRTQVLHIAEILAGLETT